MGSIQKSPVKKIITDDGYVAIPLPKDHVGKTILLGRYVYEHVYKVQKRLGRELKSIEAAVHKDGNKTNNKLSNLIIEIDTLKGRKQNNKNKGHILNALCFTCGKAYHTSPYRVRNNLYLFCSRKCLKVANDSVGIGSNCFFYSTLCSECGKEFNRPKSRIARRSLGIFCNRACYLTACRKGYFHPSARNNYEQIKTKKWNKRNLH